jgi:hypothetical protein
VILPRIGNHPRSGGGGGVPDTLLDLNFKFNAYGADMGTVNAYVVDPDTGAIIGDSVWSMSGSRPSVWLTGTANTPVVPSTFRIAWYHLKFGNGSNFLADFAIDTVNIQGNFFSFDGSNNGFLTTSNQFTTNSASAFSGAVSVPTGSDRVQGQWNRFYGSTPSANTGPSSADTPNFYLYTEASSANAGAATFWLFSPVITI